MTEPFLILHKVRGEPAFDIAEKIGEDSDGDIWIIPTSGHRAYPYRMWTLMDMSYEANILEGGGTLKLSQLAEYALRSPGDWPDHYAANDRPLAEDTYTVKKRAAGILESLGLVKPVTVERRF